MVVHGDREDFLGPLLTDHILGEVVVDLFGLQCTRLKIILPLELIDTFIFFQHYLVAQLNALITDVDVRTGNQFFDFVLIFPAE